MILTEIWKPHPKQKDVLTFQGYRDIQEVFDEAHEAVIKQFKHDENIGFEYLALDWDMRIKGAKWPNGYIAVFVLPGGSEAYRVNLCVMNPLEGYKQMMSCKVWSEKGAHEVCKFIQRLFYFEGNMEVAA